MGSPQLKLHDLVRTALAEAIEQASDAELNRNAAQEGVDRTRRLVDKAHGNLDAATAEVTRTRQERATQLSKGHDDPGPVRQARADEANAIDDLEAAQSAYALAESGLRAAEVDCEKKRKAIDLAADNVLRTLPAAVMLAETQAVQDDLIKRRVALRFLHRGYLDGQIAETVRSFLLNTAVLPSTVGGVEYEDWNLHPVTKAMLAYRSALMTDPDLELDI